jgi:ATP-dependent Lon protease
MPLIQIKGKQEAAELPPELPVLPLRNVVAFPYSVMPLSVGLPRSVRLIEDVIESNRLVVLVAMIDPTVEEPGPEGVYQVGTLAQVERAMRVDDGSYQVLVRGLARVRITQWLTEGPYLKAHAELWPEKEGDATEMEALRRELLGLARRLVVFLPQVPDGVVDMLEQVTDLSLLLYIIASNIRMEI